jgi:hypothetical protein
VDKSAKDVRPPASDPASFDGSIKGLVLVTLAESSKDFRHRFAVVSAKSGGSDVAQRADLQEDASAFVVGGFEDGDDIVKTR